MLKRQSKFGLWVKEMRWKQINRKKMGDKKTKAKRDLRCETDKAETA